MKNFAIDFLELEIVRLSEMRNEYTQKDLEYKFLSKQILYLENSLDYYKKCAGLT